MTSTDSAAPGGDRFFDLSHDMLFIGSLDGYFKHVNPAFQNALGYTAGELLEKPFFDLVHPDDLPGIRAAFETMRTSEQSTCSQFRIRCKDGSYKWSEWVGSLSAQGGLFCAAGRDVTERKHAEEELRKSEEWFRNSFDYAAAGMIIETVDGHFLRVNPAACDFFGYPEQELLCKHYAELTHPEDVGIGRQETGSLLGGALSSFHIEKRYVRKNGDVRWAHVVVSAMRDLCGKPFHMIAQIIDITERKRTEEALRASEQVLRQSREELRALTGDLIAIQEEERSRISRELHDDLNQQLAVLALDAAEVERECPRCPEPALARLRALQERLGRLSDDVHSIAYRLHPAVLDLLGLAPAMESLCAQFSSLKKIPTEFAQQDVPGPIPEDVSLCLYRIAQEALRNVAEHANASQAVVTLKGARTGVGLVIEDFGAGFDPELVKAKRGLGLISIRERVRLVNGELSLQSEPGKGTRVEVWVPLSTEVTREAAADTAGG